MLHLRFGTNLGGEGVDDFYMSNSQRSHDFFRIKTIIKYQNYEGTMIFILKGNHLLIRLRIYFDSCVVE